MQAIGAVVIKTPLPTADQKTAVDDFPHGALVGGVTVTSWMSGNTPDQTRQQLEREYERFTFQKDIVGMVGCCIGIINASLMECDDFSLLPRFTAELSRLHALAGKAVPHELEVELICCVALSLVCHDPGNPDLPRWIMRARQLMKSTSDPVTQLRLGSSAILHYLWSGNASEALCLLEQLGMTSDTLQNSSHCLVEFRWVNSLSSIYFGRFDQVSTGLHSAPVNARPCSIKIHDFIAVAQAAVASIMAGQAAKAHEFVTFMQNCGDFSKRIVSCVSNLVTALEMQSKGKLHEGRGHVNNALELSRINCPFTALLSRLLATQLYFDTGEVDRAYFMLAESRQVSLSSNSKIGECVCCLLEAYFRLSRDPANKAGLEVLRAGLHIGKVSEIIFHPGMSREALTYLCIKAFEHEIEPGHVQKIVSLLKLSPESLPVELEQWPWPLKIYTLGRFGLVRNGIPIRFTGKVQQKPMEMLKALIAFGGRNVAEEKICDMLWPNAAGDDAHKSFVVTLHRLRRLLGEERFILYNEALLSLNQHCCWVDVWAFNRHAGLARTLNNSGSQDPIAAIKASQKAISLYNGHFLAGDTRTPWAFSTREMLRAKMVQIIASSGHYWEEAGEWRKAVENYLKGLETDDLVEEHYQRLMLCHQQMGDRGAALSIYKRCAAALAAFGIEPSDATKGIYEALFCRS